MAREEDRIQDDDFSADELIIRKKKTPEVKVGVTAESVLDGAAQALAALREKSPLVHCMANAQTAAFAVDALLALGADPAVVEDSGEASPFAAVADGVLVDLDAITKPYGDAMRAAVSRANMAGRPWTLNPASIGGALPLRTFVAKELMRRFPAVICGDAAEIAYLTGNERAWAHGAAASLPALEEVAPQTMRLAGVTHSAVVLSGEVCYVAAEGAPLVAVANDAHAISRRVAGFPCMRAALASAFLGTLGARARWESAMAAAVVSAAAGKAAAKKASAPMAFRAAYVDALFAISPEDVKSLAKVQVMAG